VFYVPECDAKGELIDKIEAQGGLVLNFHENCAFQIYPEKVKWHLNVLGNFFESK